MLIEEDLAKLISERKAMNAERERGNRGFVAKHSICVSALTAAAIK